MKTTISTTILTAARRLQAGRVAAFGSLKDIAREVPGATIGQLHDAVRELVRQGRVRLHPYTGSQYRMAEFGCDYALIMGCEIMLYIEAL